MAAFLISESVFWQLIKCFFDLSKFQYGTVTEFDSPYAGQNTILKRQGNWVIKTLKDSLKLCPKHNFCLLYARKGLHIMADLQNGSKNEII